VGLERRVLFERELRELEYGLLSLVSLAAKALLFSVVCLQRISRGLRRSFGRQKKVTTKTPSCACFCVLLCCYPYCAYRTRRCRFGRLTVRLCFFFLKRLPADVRLRFSKYVGWANDCLQELRTKAI